MQLVDDQREGQPSMVLLVLLFAFCNKNTDIESFVLLHGSEESSTVVLIRFGHIQRLHFKLLMAVYDDKTAQLMLR